MAPRARSLSLSVPVVLQVVATQRLPRAAQRVRVLPEALFRLLRATAPPVAASLCLAVPVLPTLVARCASVRVSAVVVALVAILRCLRATRRAMSRLVDLCVPPLVTAMQVAASHFVRVKVLTQMAVAWLSRRVPALRLRAAALQSARRLAAVPVAVATCS